MKNNILTVWFSTRRFGKIKKKNTDFSRLQKNHIWFA